MSKQWKIHAQTAAEAGSDWFWCKPVLVGEDSCEGFTIHNGFCDKRALEERDDCREQSMSQAEADARGAQHGCAAETTGQFRGSYTCRAQTRSFKYVGSWTLRGGVIDWAATVRFFSTFSDARGTVLEAHPARTAEALRHSVEQWIDAFSCGQTSLR